MFEEFKSRYDLRAHVVTRTGLHIGAGGSLAVTGSDNPVVRDARGLPFIPGSSFKGALRSAIEAIVRGLSAGMGQEPWTCDPLQSPCVTAEDMRDKNDAEISKLVEQGVPEGGKACTVCRLFGSPWLASKVKVKDLYVVEDEVWPGRIEVRDGVAIDRDTETAATGRLYDYEVVPLETNFDLHIRIDNPSKAELGLLFLGLREFSNGGAALGGKVSRGLGAVQLKWQEIEVIEGHDGLRAYLRDGHGRVLEGEEADTFQRQCIEAFLKILGEGGQDAG